MSVFRQLLDNLNRQQGNFLVLLDPDQKNQSRLEELVQQVNTSGVDAILVGGSLIMDDGFQERLETIKILAEVPVILFPGSANQLSRHADAILFMSLLSGRNPQYLINEQVQAAPIVKYMDLEVIPTAYLLMSGGRPTAVEFMSNTTPLPVDKPDIALAHALAGQYLGMQLIYLEAGSGAERSVPSDLIRYVAASLEIPIVVGGGIRTPEMAAEKIRAGARFIVTGTVNEKTPSGTTMLKFAEAIHNG